MSRHCSSSYAAQIRPSKCIIAEVENTGQGQKHVIREAPRLFIQRWRIELSFCFPPAGSKQPAPSFAAALSGVLHGAASWW